MPGYFGGAYGDLSLRTQKFVQGLREAVNQARRAGQNIASALSIGAGSGMTQLNQGMELLTKRTRGYMKDVSRIVTGILISQGFYRTINAVEQAIGTLGEFHDELQRSTISFTTLLGSAEKARSFIVALQRLAEETPFTFESAQLGARRLMAMGFAAENVIPILRDISDMVAVTGQGPDALERIVRALGQMKTKGKVVTQEMMQLTEAGVPAFEILQEELGLTRDQLENIAKLKIPADIGIAAILSGIRKRYSGAAKQLENTYGAIITRIGERLLFIADTLVGGAFDRLRERAAKVADTLGDLRDALMTGGFEAFVRRLLPPELRQSFKTVVASILSLKQSIADLWTAIKPILAAVGSSLLRAAAIVLPILTGIVRAITGLARWAATATPLVNILAVAIGSMAVANIVTSSVIKLYNAIKLLFIAGPVSNMIKALTGAIIGLHGTIVKNPIIAVITLLAAALLGLALSSKTVSAWLDRIIKQLGILGGFNVDELIKPTDPADVSEMLEQYNKSLQDSIGNLEDVGDGLKDTGKEGEKAGKKIKDTFLASFDEVHDIPDKLGETEDKLGDLGDALRGLDNINFPTLEGPGDRSGLDEEDITGSLQLPRQIVLPPLIWPDPPTTPPPGAVAEVLEVALEAIRNAFARVGETAAEIASKWTMVTTAFNVAKQAVIQWVNDTAASLKQWPSMALEGIRQGLVDIGNELSQWATNTLTTISSWCSTSVSTLWQWAYDAISPVKQWTWQALTDIRTWTSNAMTEISTWTSIALSSLRGWVSDALSAIGNFARDMPKKIWEGLQRAGTHLVQAFSDWLGQWNTHHMLLTGIIAMIISMIIGKFEELPTGVKGAIASIPIVASTIFGNMKTAVAQQLDETKTIVVNKGTEVANWLKTKWEEIKTNAGIIWGNIVSTISGKLQEIVGKTKGFASDIYKSFIDKLNDIITWTKDWGKRLVEGLWEGIRNAGSWLKDRISGWADSIATTVKSGFKIHSPSKVMAEIGEQLTAGLAVGMENNLAAVRSATNSLRDSIKKDFSKQLSVDLAPAMSMVQRGVLAPHQVAQGVAAATPVIQRSQPEHTPIFGTMGIESLGLGRGNNTYEINVGTLIADELSLKILARRIRQYIEQENTRIG